MNLYLLSQSDNTGYDTFDSCIVAAKNEEEARHIHPDGSKEWSETISSDWTTRPEKVKVELIGKAIKGTESGVILASFNAG